jgi:hypothetical protein
MGSLAAHVFRPRVTEIVLDQTNMTENYSKSRQQAEAAFAAVQSQFLAKDRSAADLDPANQAREENTLRLKKARLAKESGDAAKVLATASPRTGLPGPDVETEDTDYGSDT